MTSQKINWAVYRQTIGFSNLNARREKWLTLVWKK